MFPRPRHAAQHKSAVEALFQPASSDLLRVQSRRWFLQAGLAGVAGLATPDLLRLKAQQTAQPQRETAVILIWLSGGPSQLDTWDPKPAAPAEIRGPFSSIPTNVAGVRVSEHFPLQARIAHRLVLIRSVDCSSSTDHYPAPMQAGNPLAQRRGISAKIATHPSMGSVAARFRGPGISSMPALVGLADPPLWFADVLGAGPLGGATEPVRGHEMVDRLSLPRGVNIERADDRAELCRQFDNLRRDLDVGDTMGKMDLYRRQALEVSASGRAQRAFRIDLESNRLRDAYGRHSLGERTLLARRLVEAGVTFVTVSGTFGVFDNHGDDVIWGGLIRGLKPLLPVVDQAVSALVNDLDARGMLESTLVLVMGEFGRSPRFSQRGTGGREHWSSCMSMMLAGGGLDNGPVIGSSDASGGEIRSGRITPSDIGATVYRHLGIDLASTWIDAQGRSQPIVVGNGRPIQSLR